MGITLPYGLKNEFDRLARGVLDSGNLAEGEIRKSIEDRFSNNSCKSILLNSCGSGIFSALMYYKVVYGKSIALVQSNTFYGVSSIARLAGYKVIIVPCNGLTMNFDSLVEILNNMDKAYDVVVIYSHIGGANHTNKFTDIFNHCVESNTPIIEDSAHSFGIQDKVDYQIGNLICRVYSFYATKTASAGEGGLLITPDKDTYDWIYDFIMYDRLKMTLNVGLNLRVSEIQALLIKLVIDNIVEIIHNRFSTLLEYKDICDQLGIRYYKSHDYIYNKSNHNGYKFIITDERILSKIPSYLQTGKVFDYALTNNGYIEHRSMPHICLNTNYGVSQKIIDQTIKSLKESIK